MNLPLLLPLQIPVTECHHLSQKVPCGRGLDMTEVSVSELGLFAPSQGS